MSDLGGESGPLPDRLGRDAFDSQQPWSSVNAVYRPKVYGKFSPNTTLLPGPFRR